MANKETLSLMVSEFDGVATTSCLSRQYVTEYLGLAMWECRKRPHVVCRRGASARGDNAVPALAGPGDTCPLFGLLCRRRERRGNREYSLRQLGIDHKQVAGLIAHEAQPAD